MQIQKLFRCVHRNLTGLRFHTIPVTLLRNFDKELDHSKKNDLKDDGLTSTSEGNASQKLGVKNMLNSNHYANGDMLKEFDAKRQQLLQQQENGFLFKGAENATIEQDYLEDKYSSSNEKNIAQKKTELEDEMMDTLEESFILELEDDEFDSNGNKEDDELIGLNSFSGQKEGILSYNKTSHNISLLENSNVITSSEENTGSYKNIKQLQMAHQKSWNKAGRKPVSFKIQDTSATEATKQYPNSSDENEIDGIESNNENAKEGLDPKSAEEIRRDIVELLRSSSISLTEKVSYLKLAVNEQTLVPTLSQFILDFYDKSVQELQKLEQDALLDAIYVYSLTLSCLPYPASTLLQQQFLQKIQQLPLVSFLDAKKVLYLLNKHNIFNKSIIVASFSIFKHTMLLNTFPIEDRLEFFEYFVNNQKAVHSSKSDMCTSNQLKIIYLQGGLADLLSNFQAACRFNQSFSLRLLHAISLLRFDIQSIRETQRKCIDIQALPNLSNTQLLFLMQIIYSSNFHFPEILQAIFQLCVKRLPTILDKKTNPDYMYQFIQFYKQIGTEIFPDVSEEQYLELKTIYNTHLSQIIELQTLPYSILMAFLFVQASSPFFQDKQILNLIMQAIEKKRKKSGFKSDLVCLPYTVAFFQIKNPDLWWFLISSFECRKVRDPSHFSQFALGFNYCLNNVEELKDSQELKQALSDISQKIRIFQRQKQNMNFSTALVEFQKHFKINCFVIQSILKNLSIKARFFDTIEGCLYNTIVINDWRSLVAAAESADEFELVEDINTRFTSKMLIQLNQHNQFHFDKTKDLVVLMDKPRFFNKQGLIEYNLQLLTSRGYNVISIGQEIGDWCDPCDFQSTKKFTNSIIQKFRSIQFPSSA